MSVEVQQSDVSSAVVVRFEPSWLRYVRGPRRDLDQILGDNPRAVFAVDGTMFESTAGTDAFLIHDSVTGAHVPTQRPAEGMTIAVVDGVASGTYGGIMPPRATVAVQTWPSLVRDGVAVPHDTPANRERVWRVGMGVGRDGRIVVVMLVGSLLALSQRMVVEGVLNGGYLDGGSSLAAEARGVFRRVHTPPSGSRVPGWVLAVPPDSSPSVAPSPRPAATSSGLSAGKVAAVGGLALAVLFGWILTSDA